MTILTKEQILCAGLAPGFARLQRVALRLSEGTALDDDDVAFLADAFQRIVGGAHADDALDVVRKKGRPAMTGKQADVWFQHVIEVERFRLENKGSTLADALEHVARTRHVAVTTLEDWHKRYRETALNALRWVAAELKARRVPLQLMERQAEFERSATRFLARHAATKGGNK